MLLCLERLSMKFQTRSRWNWEVGHASIQSPAFADTGLPALVEPLSVAWHSINVSPFKKGDAVLVLGGGPIGLAVIQCLKARGAEKIIASEVSPGRRAFTKQLGAHYTLDPTTDDVVARVREICGGVGADVAFDAAGVQVGLDQALKAIRAQGTLVNIAVWNKPAQLQMNDLVFREKKYVGVTTFVQGDFREVLDAIASGESLESLLTGHSLILSSKET